MSAAVAALFAVCAAAFVVSVRSSRLCCITSIIVSIASSEKTVALNASALAKFTSTTAASASAVFTVFPAEAANIFNDSITSFNSEATVAASTAAKFANCCVLSASSRFSTVGFKRAASAALFTNLAASFATVAAAFAASIESDIFETISDISAFKVSACDVSTLSGS